MNIDITNPDDRASVVSSIGNMIKSSLDARSIKQHADAILDEYIIRTNHHIWLVNQCAKILRDVVIKHGQDIEMFDTNVEFHDYDKLHNSDILPTYALACHYFYFHNKTVPYTVDEEWLNHEFEEVAWPKHHQANKHHYAEYYGKKDENGFIDVPETYDILNLIEMYADWMAMGITQGGTAKDWWQKNYGEDKHWDFHGRDLGVIQECILAEENAVNQLAYLRQFKDVEPSWVPPTVIETFEDEDPIAAKEANEGIENFFNYQSNETLGLKRDDLYIGPIDPMIIDPEKMMKLSEYPELLLALKQWTTKPDHDLAPQLIMLGKIVDDIYKFKNSIVCYRGIRTGFSTRPKQNLMGVIDDEIDYLRLLKPGFDKPGTTFEFETPEPMSVTRSPYLAKVYGNFIVKTEVPADANKLVITPELSYLLQQMEVDYPEYRAVNLSVTHEVIVFSGTKLTFEIVSVYGDISSELETMKEHSFEGLGNTEMNGVYYSVESVQESKDKLPKFLYISGTESNIKDGYLSFRKADTTWDEEYKEWNNNFDVYKTPNGVKRELQKSNHHLNKNTTYYAIGLPTELIKDSVFFEKGKIWFRPQKDYMIKAKEWDAVVLDLGKTTSDSTEALSDKESDVSISKYNGSKEELEIIRQCVNLSARSVNPKDEGYDKTTFEKLVNDKSKGPYWIIRNGNDIIGSVSIRSSTVGADEVYKCSAINDFAILEKYQGKGLGKKALLAIIDYIRKTMKYKDIGLGVGENNTKAISLYKSVGFKRICGASWGEGDQKFIGHQMLLKYEESSNEALSPDVKKKKQLIIDYICSVCDIMDPSKLNSKRYHRLLDSMNDKEFDQWMNYVKEGKWKIHIVAPNLVVILKNENSLKAADKVKCKLFHRLWMTDDSTGRQYLTDNEYLVLNLPVRRQQQFLDEKMSVPDNDKQIDGMTGQVTGDSKSSAVTNPEIQILAARGLDATLEEFVNVRGGNIAAYSDFKRQAEETGEIKLNSLDPNTRSRVAVVGQVLLRSMMIENNILE